MTGDRWFAVIASCPYRDEVRRYDLLAASAKAAGVEAADRYGHESTIGVDVADVEVEVIGERVAQPWE